MVNVQKPAPPPTIPRTAALLAAYDALLEAGEFIGDEAQHDPEIAEVLDQLGEQLKQLGALIGHVYGVETRSLGNSVRTCAENIRPGPKKIPLGETQPSFLRRMVALWEAAQAGRPDSEVDRP